MSNNSKDQIDPRKEFAAEEARGGVIGILDLSLLTGVSQKDLTSLARNHTLKSYSEYHGKRFFKFEEVVSWATENGKNEPARTLIRTCIESEAQRNDCPYTLEASDNSKKVVWKERIAA